LRLLQNKTFDRVFQEIVYVNTTHYFFISYLIVFFPLQNKAVDTFRSYISFLALLLIKGVSRLLFRFEIGWPNGDKNVNWKEIRLIVLLNHTSLLEPLYLGFLPIKFLRRLSRRMVAPGADKTLDRPFVGALYKLFSPGMVAITRKRDDSWQQFMDSIYEDSVIAIIPEGRMKRAYHIFKTVKMNLETFDIEAYKASFNETVGSEAWRKKVIDDLQLRLETKIPVL